MTEKRRPVSQGRLGAHLLKHEGAFVKKALAKHGGHKPALVEICRRFGFNPAESYKP